MIRFPVDQKVSITFESFDVEYHSSCGFDFLAVYDGDSSSSPIIGSSHCGTIAPGTTINSTQNLMTILFHSDSSATEAGFKFRTDIITIGI